MTSASRRLALALFGLWVASVAYLTLTPAGYTPPLTLRGFFCVACGELDGSDMLRNWILFVPGGLLAGLALPGWRGLLLPVALTAVVEFVQIGVPGRDPAAQDLVLNALGAVTGALVAFRGLAPWARRLTFAAAIVAWLAPIALLIPRTTPYPLYGQWTPRFGNRAAYEGKILSSRVGNVELHSWRTDEKTALDAAILARAPVRLGLIVGQMPRALAPVFQIMDGEQQGVFELHALHSDLIVRGHNPARVLKLDQPDVRWHDAMAGLSPGDTVTLVIERARGSVCMSIDEREQCNLAPSLGDGWGFVLNLEGPPRWFRELLSLAWALGLGGLIGMTTRTWRWALGITAATALAGYIGPMISPEVSPDLIHAAMLVLGGLAGAALREPVVRLWRAARPT